MHSTKKVIHSKFDCVCPVEFRIGRGNGLVQLLDSESVSTGYLIRSDRPTTLSLVGVDQDGQPEYTFYGANTADCGIEKQDLPSIDSNISGLHFGSYSLVVQPVADAFADLVERGGDRFVSLDPNVRPSIEPDMDIWRERVAHYAGCADLLKISAEDMDCLYPGMDHGSKVDDWLGAGIQLVVITDGGSKVRAWSAKGLHYSTQPPTSDVVDTVGAGDSFQAALLAQLLHEGEPGTRLAELDAETLGKLIDFAARAAAVTCSRKGPDLPRIDELN